MSMEGRQFVNSGLGEDPGLFYVFRVVGQLACLSSFRRLNCNLPSAFLLMFVIP